MSEPVRVIPLERLAHARSAAGRRQERLARRNDRRARSAPASACPAVLRRRLTRFASFCGRTGSAAHRGCDPAPRRRRRPRAGRRRRDDSRLDRRDGAASGADRRKSSARIGRLADGADATAFAVRSSATAEDLPDASFAGQQDTFLNINGLENILKVIPRVFASVYNDRAIAYRVHHGFAHHEVALSVGVQRMVRSDTGAAGRDVHARHRIGLRSGRADHIGVRARRVRRAGRGESGRVLRLQAEPRRGASGDPAQEHRQQGDADGPRRRGQCRASRHASSTCRKRSGCGFR